MTPLLFHKYHGLGNDYLVCHRSVADRLSQEQIRLLCHPHYGIGSDGLLIDSGDAVNPTLRIINPDGSEAEKSGNGLRIYARYLFDSKRVAHQPFLVHTAGGDVRCQVAEDAHQITVEMGRANFSPAALPALIDLPEALNYPLPLKEETLSVSLVSMGNPHCVVPVEKLDLAQVHRLDRRLSPSAVPETHQCTTGGSGRSPDAAHRHLGARRRLYPRLRQQQLRRQRDAQVGTSRRAG